MHSETLGVLIYTTASDTTPAPTSYRGTTAVKELNESELVLAHIMPAPSDISLAIPFTFSIQRTHFQNWRSCSSLKSEPAWPPQAFAPRTAVTSAILTRLT
ncbi:hypothetical protein B0H10DRAFT_2231005 [Mycena sp. CBHHK59/15]|nr:hypothetical protein B0H10DRAFT_2231005 [Mycena sp. CBHHK59/15]